MITAEEFLKEHLPDSIGWSQHTHESILHIMSEYAKIASTESLKAASQNFRMKSKENIDDLSMMDEWFNPWQFQNPGLART